MTHPRSRAALAATLAAASLTLGACGGGDDEGDTRQAAQTQAVTTPPEGGEIVERRTDEASTREKGKKGEKAADRDAGGTGGDTKGSGGSAPSRGAGRAPAAPNSKGPYGPEEVEAPAVKKGAPGRAAVEKTVRTYLRAIARSDGRTACSQMTREGQVAIARKIAEIAPETGGAACREAIVLYQGAYGDTIKNPKVGRVRIAGDRATAIGPLEQVARLERVSGRWLIAEYGQ